MPTIFIFPAFLTRFFRLLFGRMHVLPKPQRGQRSFVVEPLDERHLLAADGGMSGLGCPHDLGNMSMAAIFPQPRSYYESVSSASLVSSDHAHRDETALVRPEHLADESTSPATSDATVESQRIAAIKSCERKLLERLGQSVYAGLEVDSSENLQGESPLRGGGGGDSLMLFSLWAFDAGRIHNYAAAGAGNVSSHELVVFQDTLRECEILVSLSLAEVPQDVVTTVEIVALDNSGHPRQDSGGNTASDYWTKDEIRSHDTDSYWTWAMPAGLPNADALRDFQIVATVSSQSLDVTMTATINMHVAYAEIVIQFAGQGGFAPRSATGGQTVDNTVVVGQKVHAKMDVDPFLTVTSYLWSEPSGGVYYDDAIHNYITNDTVGHVEYLWDVYGYPEVYGGYVTNELEYYYTNIANPLRTGGVSCEFVASYVQNGKTVTVDLSRGASYYIEAPTATLAAITNGSSYVKDTFIVYNPILRSPEIRFLAEIDAPTFSGGKVDFLQTVQVQRDRSGPTQALEEKTSNKVDVLDTNFPYGFPLYPNFPGWYVDAGSSLHYYDEPSEEEEDAGHYPLWTDDLVETELHHNSTFYSTDDHFTMYLIFKPDSAVDSNIWVPLIQLEWNWTVEATRANVNSTWAIVPNSDTSAYGSSSVVSTLPIWTENVVNLTWKQKKPKQV